MPDRPANPMHESALTAADLREGRHIIVIDNVGDILFRGALKIASEPSQGAVAVHYGEAIVHLDLIEIGVEPEAEGKWRDACTLPSELSGEFVLPE